MFPWQSWSESQKSCASRSCKNMINLKMHSIITFYLFNRCLFSALWFKSLKVPVFSRSLYTILEHWILTFKKLSGWDWSFKLKSMIIFSLNYSAYLRLPAVPFIPLDVCQADGFHSQMWATKQKRSFESEAAKLCSGSQYCNFFSQIQMSNPKSQSLNLRFAGRLLEAWLAQIG